MRDYSILDLANRKSKANFLLLVNLWLDSKSNNLLIQFSIIDFLCLLDLRDLDTSLHCVPLSMTKWWRFVFDSWICKCGSVLRTDASANLWFASQWRKFLIFKIQANLARHYQRDNRALFKLQVFRIEWAHEVINRHHNLIKRRDSKQTQKHWYD